MTRSAGELDPQLQEIEDIREARNIPESYAVTPETAREQLEAVTADANDRIETAVAETNDFDIKGPGGALSIRSYHPEGNGPHPIVVFYHSGGFVYGSPDTHDNVCRALCDAAGALVLSVHYRLAPRTRSRRPSTTPTPPRSGPRRSVVISAAIPTGSSWPATARAATSRRWSRFSRANATGRKSTAGARLSLDGPRGTIRLRKLQTEPRARLSGYWLTRR